MAVPNRTTEQRRDAAQRAVLARQRRAELSAQLKSGALGLLELLALAQTDDAVAAMRVSAVLASLPRMGSKRSADAMAQLRISPSRRVRGIGSTQRAALIALAAGRQPASVPTPEPGPN